MIKKDFLNKLVATILMVVTFVAVLPLNMVTVFANLVTRVPSGNYTANFMYHSQWDDNTQFSHGISLVNTGNQVIRNWRIYFELPNGVVHTTSHGTIESSTGTVVIAQVPSSQIYIWPGQNHFVTIGGTAQGESLNVQNIRLYGTLGPAGGDGNNQGGGNDGLQPAPVPPQQNQPNEYIPNNPHNLPVSVQFRNPNIGNVLSQLDPWFRITAHQNVNLSNLVV